MNLRVLSLDYPEGVNKYMKALDVYKEGIDIMAPKSNCLLINLEDISSVAANILKQEMLSISGEVAVPKDVIIGKKKNTDCLIIGSLSQLRQLRQKIKRQPFGLNRISDELNSVVDNYIRRNFVIKTSRHRLSLGKRTLVMGIINLTPDSFSGDGFYSSGIKFHDVQIKNLIIKDIEKIIKDGADIIDIGGQSSRPGCKPVSTKEEINRVIPIIKKLAKKIKVPISIDTYRPEVANAALAEGASIVNNIMGCQKNKKMLKIVAKYKSALVIMHMKGNPRTMQRNPSYKSLMSEIVNDLSQAKDFAIDSGIDKEKIIVDPGIGFGKSTVHNLEIINRLSELKSLGRPILIGTSRKSFIGNVLNLPLEDRLMGTSAAVTMSIRNGANIVRVHDVKKVKEVVKLTDSIMNPN